LAAHELGVRHVAADRVQSDHQLIVSDVRLPSPVAPAPDVIDGSEAEDNTSFLVSHHRYRTLSHGGEHYWDAFREECTSLLPSLSDRLLILADGDGCTGSKVEAAWAEFKDALRNIAATTIGIRSMHTRLTSHHHQHRSTADPLLRQWRDGRGCLRAELRSTPIDQDEKRGKL